MNKGSVLCNCVEHREGKAFRKQAMVLAINHSMDSGIEFQRIDVRAYALQKVPTDSRFKILVKLIALDEIVLGFFQDLNPHEVRFAMCSFAVSQSINFALPSSIWRWRSSSSSLCQFGTG